MKLSPILIIAFLIATITACKTNEFPDSTTSQISNEHFRMKGTKLFVVAPDNSTYFEDIHVFKFNDSAFIHCMYMPSNFIETLKKDTFGFIYNNDYKIITRKDFTINNKPGVYFKLLEKNAYWLYFMYGDSLAENMIVAGFPTGSSLQDTIFDFVKRSYYKPDYQLDPTESAKFSIDLPNLGFKFAGLTMNQYVFIENEAENYLAKNENPNVISIAQMQPATDSTGFKTTADIMIQSMQYQGIILNELKSAEFVRVNQNSAYKVIINGEADNKEVCLYMVVSGNSNTQVVFLAILYHSAEELLPKIDNTIQTLILQ